MSEYIYIVYGDDGKELQKCSSEKEAKKLSKGRKYDILKVKIVG